LALIALSRKLSIVNAICRESAMAKNLFTKKTVWRKTASGGE